MNKVILKSISATNFAPFADRIEFTTQIDKSKKEFLENTFTVGDETLNKVSFVYGANGSGKSFFCKILREIQRLIMWSPLTFGNTSKLLPAPLFQELEEQSQRFKFDLEYNDKPTSFSVDIILSEITYHYEFSIQDKKVIYELLTKKYRRKEVLMERTSESYKDIEVRSDFKDFASLRHSVKEDALCLAIADVLGNQLAHSLVRAINSIGIFNMASPKIPPAMGEESFSKERCEKYIKVLKKADPTLRQLKVDVAKERVKHDVDVSDFENREIITTQISVTVNAKHAIYNKGKEITGNESSAQQDDVDFFSDESLGTVKLLTMLPQLFDVLEDGGVLVLDEIENGLHLSLVKDIIKLFIDSNSNPYNAQLICTTHQPLLVDGNTRRDQVWILSKNEFGKSSMHRLSSLSTSRAKVNITNKLLENAFCCNPEPFFK
ncbi:MAG: ATP-binding protein [Oscillospiraceae bacterium]|nr:ATP-binding protein [Oscillospiraceae bacterium]